LEEALLVGFASKSAWSKNSARPLLGPAVPDKLVTHERAAEMTRFGIGGSRQIPSLILPRK